MIDHNSKFIFIHIPRTGGTSIEGAFNIEMSYNDYSEKHLKASETKQLISDKIWDDYFKFSIVRNPYSRLVSCWKRGFYYPKNTGNLYDFVINFKPAKHEVQSPFYHDIIDETLDYVCRFERLKEDFSIVCNKLNINLKLPHIEKSNTEKPYQSFYDKRTKAIVSYLYNKDLKRYNYSFEDLDESTKLSVFEYYFYVFEYLVKKYLSVLKKTYNTLINSKPVRFMVLSFRKILSILK